MKPILISLLFLATPAFAEPGDAAPAPAEVEAVEEAPEAAEGSVEAPEKEADKAEELAEAKALTADAPPVEEAVDASVESVSALVDAVQNKNWALAIGLLLSILVAFANKFGLKDKVGGKAIPWVTAGLGVVGAVATALVAGIAPFEAVSQGLIAGVAAIGGWEMLLKHLLASKAQPAGEE